MAVTITNTDSSADNNVTISPYTFSALNIGTAAANRIVFAAITTTDAAGLSTFVSSVTIGGISGTAVADISAGGLYEGVVYWAVVPTGATANVVVTFSATPSESGLAIFVYRVAGASVASPVSSSATFSGSSFVDGSITVPNNGALLALGCALNFGATTFTAWTGITGSATENFTVGGLFTTDAETALSTTPGLNSVRAQWVTTAAPALLSLVAIQEGGSVTAQSLSLTSSQSVSIAVFRSKRIAVSTAQVSALSKAAGKRISIVSGNTVRLIKSSAKGVALQMAQAVALMAGVPRASSISVLSGQLINLVKFRGGPKAISLSNAQVVLANRQLIKVFNLASAQLVRLARPIQRIIHISQAQIVMLLAHAVAGSHSLVHLLANTIRRVRSLKNRIDRIRTISNTNARRKP